MVAQGRYGDFDDVIRAAVSLLQRAEAERTAFIASLDEALAEGERDGFFTADKVFREMDEMLADMARTRDKG